MKQKNMPMRKLRRQMVAQEKDVFAPHKPENIKLLAQARLKRSKKR